MARRKARVKRALPKSLSPSTVCISSSLPRGFPVPQGQSFTPVALLIVTGHEPFSTLKVAGPRTGDTADLGSVPCPGMALSVSQLQEPPMGFLLPNPSSWAGMGVIFGTGLFKHGLLRTSSATGLGTNGLLPTPLHE